ncbi:hypothetical protein AB0H83_21860 [Dactylosporangium sp. NPDC050688]|uniref:hypothetical protein n=1 Tax=Dactylosporangium sp. NPDC050688 TaxID=3157217 RepID=UPI0034010649
MAAAVVAVLAVACLVGYAAVRAALVAGDPGEPGVAVPVAPWPRPSGEQCRTGLAGLCADDDQGLAPIPGLTAAGWTGRLPEQFRPGYAQQDRDGLLEGTVPIREPVSGKPAGGSGRQMTVNSTGRATLTYGPDNLLRTVECAVDAAGLAPLSPQALDFVRQCVLATATADIAPATGAWLDARLHPEQGPVDPSGAAPATVPWSCGWLSLRLGAGPAHAVAMVTAPRQAPAPCAR